MTTDLDMTPYQYWLEANRSDLKDAWESMGLVERYEMGGDFDTFCRWQHSDLF